jgi:hypothetical protein
MGPNLETQWQIMKMERSLDLARGERLAQMGWRPDAAPSWLKRRLTGAFARQRSGQRFEREEAMPRAAARGL